MLPAQVPPRFHWGSKELEHLSPRLIMRISSDAGAPVRISSDATGAGAMASFTFPDHGTSPLPLLLAVSEDAQLRGLPVPTNRFCVFELFSAVATVYKLRSGPDCVNFILFLDM